MTKMTKTFCKECIVDFKQEILSMLIHTMEQKDTYTSGHSKRVALYADLIGEKLCLSFANKDILNKAAMMHDIGKILIYKDILQKKGKLSDIEYEEIKQHATHGYNMLKEISVFKEHAKVVKHHHEWWNGNGYPDGLKEKEIPLYSRIVAIADAFDAMTSLRDYQKNLTVKEALQELKRCSNTQFDPELVPLAIEALSEHFNLKKRSDNVLHSA